MSSPPTKNIARQRLGAFKNVGAWALRIGLAALAGEVLRRLMGYDDWLLATGSGRSFVMVFALLVTMAFMGTTEPSLRAAGLAFSRRWARHCLWGIVAGALSVMLLMLLAVLIGAVAIDEPISIHHTGDILEGLATAPLVAMVIAMVLPGWLMGELRRGWAAWTSIGMMCALGAGLIMISQPELIIEDRSWSRLPTVILALALLGVLRARTGDVALSFATATGWLAILRSTRKADTFIAGDSSALANFIAPAGDILSAPLTWIVLVVLTILAAFIRQPERDESFDSTDAFRRMQAFSHLGILAPIDVWLGALNQAKWKIDGVYLTRLAGVLVSSTLSAVVTLPERLLAPLLLSKRKIPPPVFILGVHRSGTTHLQNLLALDRQFIGARTRHVFDPFGFLITGWLMAPLLWAALPLKRPQDSVRFGLMSPNEEEYAIANMCRCSPDWSVRLPRQREEYDRFCFPEGFSETERATWERCYRLFLRKLTLFTGSRRPLLKNPFNTGRASMLASTFDGAQFIHIHRNPLHVYRSYLHLARSAHPLFQLQEDPDDATVGERFCDTYRKMEDRYYADAAALGKGVTTNVRFEDLEADPIAQIKRIYNELGMDYTPEYARRLERYVEKTRSYKKNVYRDDDLPEAERRMVEERLGQWGGV